MGELKDQSRIPKHVGIIMDGNGRWAQARGLPRVAGHRAGAETLKKILPHIKKCGVQYLTLFAFSLENWNRPEKEVSELMGLLRRYLKSETSDLHKNGARVKVIGDRTLLDKDIVEQIEGLEETTKDNTEITVIFAISYGARDEILKATQKIAKKCAEQGIDPSDITMDMFDNNLMTADIPDPDLIIRTSGELRISNFLLWQSAYAEYYFSEKLWPDFSEEEFNEALSSFGNRDRRFGGLLKQT